MHHPVPRSLRRSFTQSAVVAALLAVALLGAGPVASAAVHHASKKEAGSSQLATRSRVEGIPSASHVFVIVGENTSLGQLTPQAAPFIAGVLKPKAAWLNGYRAVPDSSSTGDYIEMTSGQNIACERNDVNPVNPNTDKAICHQKLDNVFNQLQTAHISWADWQESMPHSCAFYDDGTDWAGDVYGAHHNPAVYYDDIEGDRYVEDFDQAPDATCLGHDIPMGTTASDNTTYFDHALATGTVPRFNYIVPNDCENGHDPCGTVNQVGQFDRFVQREITNITASPAWNSRSVIVVTWDEQGDATPNDLRVGSIWYGKQIVPGVYHGQWTHASLLRTIEDEFDLRHLRDANVDNPVGDIWR